MDFAEFSSRVTSTYDGSIKNCKDNNAIDTIKACARETSKNIVEKNKELEENIR